MPHTRNPPTLGISRSAQPEDPARRVDSGTGTVVRVARLLRALAAADRDISLSELAKRLSLSSSTVHRLLDLLAGEGLVERDDAMRLYRPGMEFFRIAALVYNRMPVRVLALLFLREAAKENEENAYLGLLDSRAGKMTFAAVAESQHQLSYRVALNELGSLVTGASGLAILAWMTDEDRDQVLMRESRAVLFKNKKARAAFLKELARIREQGYAQTFGQRIKGAVGIFAPVFNAQSSVIGSLGYTVPEIRYQDSLLPRLSGAVIRHAGALSNALGYPGHDSSRNFLLAKKLRTKIGQHRRIFSPK